MKKTKIGVAAAAAVALTLSGCAGGAGGGTTASEDLRFVNVVKLIGVGWFDRMDEGIVAFAGGRHFQRAELRCGCQPIA